MCVCLPHMQLLYMLLNQRGKEQIWPDHCGRETERSGKGTREKGNDRQLEKSKEGFGACKNEKEGEGIGKKRQQE